MNAMLTSPHLWSPDPPTREGMLSLLSSAGQLERAAQAGHALPQLLRGKRLALLADDHASPAAMVFTQAATELGAHVAHLRASNAAGAPQRTAALLGRLYDAIECQGLSEAEVRRLGREAGVPVFDGIGNDAHWLNRVVDTQPDCPPLRLLQALLAATLA